MIKHDWGYPRCVFCAKPTWAKDHICSKCKRKEPKKIDLSRIEAIDYKNESN